LILEKRFYSQEIQNPQSKIQNQNTPILQSLAEIVRIIPITLDPNIEAIRFSSLFHYSTIPLFHVRGISLNAIKTI